MYGFLFDFFCNIFIIIKVIIVLLKFIKKSHKANKMKKVLFAMMAMVVAIFAAGCGSAPKEDKVTKYENAENVVFRCVSEDYYENAGIFEIPVTSLCNLIENCDETVDGFVYDSTNVSWFQIDSLTYVDDFYRLFDSMRWPPYGQKYALMFYPHHEIEKITFLFNAKGGISPELFDCSLDIKGVDCQFWICPPDLKVLDDALSRPLSIALDGPMMWGDTLVQEPGL